MTISNVLGGSIASWKVAGGEHRLVLPAVTVNRKKRPYSCASMSMTRSARRRSSGTSPGEEMKILRRRGMFDPLSGGWSQ